MKKNLAWLRLANKERTLVQENRNGFAYISAKFWKLAGEFTYRISLTEAKKKFPNMTRNEFAAAILRGEELRTEDWS